MLVFWPKVSIVTQNVSILTKFSTQWPNPGGAFAPCSPMSSLPLLLSLRYNLNDVKSTTNHFHDGFFGRFLTQIKLKLSPLNAQLFEYNLTENPFCAACGDSIETPLHFFTECISYEPYRLPLFRNLLILIPNLSTSSDFFNYMLIGSTTGNRGQRIRENKTIFRNLLIYMYKTERFTPK